MGHKSLTIDLINVSRYRLQFASTKPNLVISHATNIPNWMVIWHPQTEHKPLLILTEIYI